MPPWDRPANGFPWRLDFITVWSYILGMNLRASWKRLLAEFYTTADGNCPFLEWLRAQDVPVKKEIGTDIAVLESGKENFSRVDAKYLPDTGGLYELRTGVARLDLRSVFFFWDEDRLVFVHGFTKKSRKTPSHDLRIAKERMADYKRRHRHE